MRIAINPKHPEPRKIAQAVAVLERGGVIAYPTDTVYGLGCDISNKRAVESIYRAKRMDSSQLLSFVCADLAEVARYGVVDDATYRMLRRLIPGAYTFVLEATREVPKVLRLKRKTVGVRVPDHPVAHALVQALGRPVASTSASLDGEILIDPKEIEEQFRGVDLVLEAEGCGLTPSTIIDFSSGTPEIIREGAGPIDFM